MPRVGIARGGEEGELGKKGGGVGGSILGYVYTPHHTNISSSSSFFLSFFLLRFLTTLGGWRGGGGQLCKI